MDDKLEEDKQGLIELIEWYRDEYHKSDFCHTEMIEKAVLTGLQVRLADLKEFVGNIWYRGQTLRGEIFLQELILGSNCNNNSGVRKDTLQSGKILQLC